MSFPNVNEITAQTFSYLPVEDLCNARLTCKSFADNGYLYLAPTVRIFRVPGSLQKLKEIRGDVHLRNRVQKLILHPLETICISCNGGWQRDEVFKKTYFSGLDFSDRKAMKGVTWNRVRKEYVRRDLCQQLALDIKDMVTVAVDFPNLRTLVIDLQPPDGRDHYNSTTEPSRRSWPLCDRDTFSSTGYYIKWSYMLRRLSHLNLKNLEIRNMACTSCQPYPLPYYWSSLRSLRLEIKCCGSRPADLDILQYLEHLKGVRELHFSAVGEGPLFHDRLLLRSMESLKVLSLERMDIAELVLPTELQRLELSEVVLGMDLEKLIIPTVTFKGRNMFLLPNSDPLRLTDIDNRSIVLKAGYRVDMCEFFDTLCSPKIDMETRREVLSWFVNAEARSYLKSPIDEVPKHLMVKYIDAVYRWKFLS